MEAVLLLNPVRDLSVCSAFLKAVCIHLFQRELDLYFTGVDIALGKKDYGLNVARLLQIDVKCVAKFAFVRGNLSKRVFCRKTHRFLPLYVLGNRSKTLLLPIICKRTDLPTASRLRSEGTSPKFHRLNLNSSRDRICTFFRFRMDMDHYVLSSLASLLFPEP